MSVSDALSETCQVDFEPLGKRIDAAPATTVLAAAQQAGLALAAACGGAGRCGQCRVRILSGKVSAPTPEENLLLTDADVRDRHRLACQTLIHSHLKVHVPSASLIITQRLQITGELEAVTVDPIVRACAVEAPPPILQDPRADVERLRAAFPNEFHGPVRADCAVVRQLSSVARAHDWRVTAFLRDSELIGVLPSGAVPIGLAIDVGTTKIAASLLDLSSGCELAVTGALNPQISYGEDVISRLAYAVRKTDGARTLATAVRDTLNHLIRELTQQAGVSAEQIADICLVGNTAMTHLLLELPVRQLAVSPYVAATTAACDVKAREIGLPAAPGAYAHVLPCIGGFVGADHVAMILAGNLDQARQTTIGIDIGTNTEIALAKPDGLLTCVSCASGPAFEGASISAGMRAAAGAIEAITLTDSEVFVQTVDHAPAIGVCGSGIIDGVAELRRWQVLNARGRFQPQHPRMRKGRQGPEFLLVPAEHSGSQQDIVITQHDINQIQLAKGAIRAGLDIVLEATQTLPEEVNEIMIAGAFGAFLNVSNAVKMGLLPHWPNARYQQIGNAALSGAKWALLSRPARKRAGHIARHTRYVELTTYPQFNRRFAFGMLFPENTECV